MTIRRDTLYNLLGQLLPLALSLLTVPHYLHLIGEARFGVLALMWLVFGYMGLFDLGIGQATARELAKSGGQDPDQESQVLWTALLLSLALGLVGAIAAELLGTWFFGRHAAVDEGLRTELLAALPWAALAVPAVTLAGVLNGGLQARGAFADINVAGVLTQSLVLLAPLCVAATRGIELAGLVSAVAAARLLVLALLFWRCQRRYRIPNRLSINRPAARRLLGFGGWVTVSAAVSPLLLVLDRFLIGTQLGARAVSHYVIPFQLAERTTTLSSALGYSMFPRLAACRLEVERQRLALDGLKMLAVWTTPLVGAGLFLSGPFLSWWLTPELAGHSTAIAQLLLMAFWMSSLAMVPYTQLLATGRPDLVAKCHLIQLLPYVAFLYVALQAWGLMGAAIAFATRVAVDLLLLAHWARLLNHALRSLCIPGALLWTAYAVAAGRWPSAGWRWALGIGLCVALATWSLSHRRQDMPFSGRNHL